MKTRIGLDEQGQAVLLVVVVAVFALILIGLVSDGGLVLSQRRDLQGLADGAARAGALSANQNRSRSGATADIDPVAARAAVSAYLAQAGFTGSADVLASTTQVTVDLSQTYPLAFAKLLGLSTTTLHATSTSNPIPGP